MKMPVKQLVCDYCDDPVSVNTIGIDVNHPNLKFTICAKCLKSSFDWIAGRKSRSGKGVTDAKKDSA
jgi:hypothetical protein